MPIGPRITMVEAESACCHSKLPEPAPCAPATAMRPLACQFASDSRLTGVETRGCVVVQPATTSSTATHAARVQLMVTLFGALLQPLFEIGVVRKPLRRRLPHLLR